MIRALVGGSACAVVAIAMGLGFWGGLVLTMITATVFVRRWR